MKFRVLRIDEPELFFGGNGKCPDPQVGLLNYGPHGGMSSSEQPRITIRAGIIGTDRSMDKTKVWLDRLKYRIAAEERPGTEYKGIDFPGLSMKGPLRFEILVDSDCSPRIERSFIRSLETKEAKRKNCSGREKILRQIR